MTRLADIATFVKSNNAGVSYLTFDIGLPDVETFDRIGNGALVTAEMIAALYPVSPNDVRIFMFRPALVVKITIPRPFPSGGIDERDFDGVQQYAPLLDLDIALDR